MFLIWFLCVLQVVHGQFDKSSCGIQKGCIFYPPGCTSNCIISFSYQQDGNDLAMELSGPLTTQTQYIAIGFSDDASMGDDTVVFCRYRNGQTDAGLGYNPGKSNTIMDNSNIQTVLQTSANNNNLYCNLRQKLNPGVPNVKNLNGNLYILAATGQLTADGQLSYHGTNRQPLQRVNLTQFKKGGNGGQVIVESEEPVNIFTRPLPDWLKIVHAYSMLFGWGIFLSTGILFARHFKHHWPESTACGVKFWFALHRTLNSIGVLLTIIGTVAIFWARNWDWRGPKPGVPFEQNFSVGPLHSLIGSISCILAWIQPFNALFRCKPDSSARFIFNWIHRLLGLIGLIFALGALTIASNFFILLFWSAPTAIALWIAYLATLIVTAIVLEVLSMKRWCSSCSTTVAPEKEQSANSTGSGFSNAQSYVLLFFVVVSLCIFIPYSVNMFFMRPIPANV